MMKFWPTILVLVLMIGVSASVFAVAEGASEIEKKKKEIAALERDISKSKDEIEERQGQEFTFANHLEILTTKLVRNQSEQEVMQDKVELTKLEISDTDVKIGEAEDSLQHQQAILGSYLRDINRYDRANKMLLLLNAANISDFYNKVNYTENISGKTLDLVNGIDTTREELEVSREISLNKKLEQGNLLGNLKIYEAEVARAQTELDVMRQRNNEEINSLADTVVHTTEIREQLKEELFALTREGQSIKFQEAATLAAFASEQTGVRQELIMSMVKQETDFGNNVGNGTYKEDMKPDQWETFIAICLDLGKSAETTPVSAQPSYGWGGAMGIAQFLPKTWLTVNEEVSRITGNSPADPWNPKDAFTAVGVKLRNMGATGGNRDKEWEAAGRYFAGGNYKKFPWYADNVLDRAEKYKDMLKNIE